MQWHCIGDSLHCARQLTIGLPTIRQLTHIHRERYCICSCLQQSIDLFLKNALRHPELVFSGACNVANPWEGSIVGALENLEITNLHAGRHMVRNFKCHANGRPASLRCFFCHDSWKFERRSQEHFLPALESFNCPQQTVTFGLILAATLQNTIVCFHQDGGYNNKYNLVSLNK